jgi:hypothetical protein
MAMFRCTRCKMMTKLDDAVQDNVACSYCGCTVGMGAVSKGKLDQRDWRSRLIPLAIVVPLGLLLLACTGIAGLVGALALLDGQANPAAQVVSASNQGQTPPAASKPTGTPLTKPSAGSTETPLTKPPPDPVLQSSTRKVDTLFWPGIAGPALSTARPTRTHLQRLKQRRAAEVRLPHEVL